MNVCLQTRIGSFFQPLWSRNCCWLAPERFFLVSTILTAFDLRTLPTLLTLSLFQKIALELGALKQQGRQNKIDQVKVKNERLFTESGTKTTSTKVIAQIQAQARDQLFEAGELVSEDQSTFVEYWEFLQEKSVWKLNAIRQGTEVADKLNPEIQAFAAKQGFFYDPDFGSLMLPNKGVLFGRTRYQNADINNHVIGEFRKVIVEFYSFLSVAGGSKEYLVAQAVLPISYRGILVERRRFRLWKPTGLKEVVFESRDFNKKMIVWADPADQVASFELLHPDSMERLIALPFDLRLEVVGHFLYLYTDESRAVDYQDLLDILTRAFAEMKM